MSDGALHAILGALAGLTVINVALTVVSVWSLTRVRSRARDVEFWFMQTVPEDDDDD